MFNKLKSVGGFVGANVGLAASLTLTYLVGLIPHYPSALLRIFSVVIFLLAWKTFSVFGGADFAKKLVALLSDQVQARLTKTFTPQWVTVAWSQRNSLRTTAVTALWVTIAWSLIGLPGGTFVRLWYVLTVSSLILTSLLARAFTNKAANGKSCKDCDGSSALRALKTN